MAFVVRWTALAASCAFLPIYPENGAFLGTAILTWLLARAVRSADRLVLWAAAEATSNCAFDA